jgi:hypothetical protein
LLSSAV